VKVVLFSGGQGTRLRGDSVAGGPLRRDSDIPKPLQTIGGHPLLWHLMRWYAHFGHTDFVICTGFGAELVRAWVLGLAGLLAAGTDAAGTLTALLGGDDDPWHVTVVDTGVAASVGERLLAVRHHLDDEPWFLANYADTFTDVRLPEVIAAAQRADALVTLLAVPPPSTMHAVHFGADHLVRAVRPLRDEGARVNGGYFVMQPGVFDHLRPGEDLVEAPFARLAAAGRLLAHPYDGFWLPLDTMKDRLRMEALWHSGERPWAVWERPRGEPALPAVLISEQHPRAVEGLGVTTG